MVEKEDEILLGRAPHFEPGIYSALAGFVELGETAEEALHREVKEEVGLEVCDLKYQGSQTWPFPDSFMIAFSARYQSGVLSCSDELEDAQWFKKSALPPLHPTGSISRRLIDRVVSS